VSGTVSTGDLARLLSGIGAWITGAVAASPTPTPTQFAVTGYDFTAAPSLAGALVIVGQVVRRVGQVAANSGATLTLSTALASAPAAGDPVLIFPEVSVNFSGAENIAEVGGQAVPTVGGVPSVPVTVEGAPTVTANQGAAGTSAWPQNVAEVGGTAVPTVNGVPSVPVTAGLVLADTVAPGTAAAATTPLLRTYGSPAAPYTVPAQGTVNVAVALSAAATLTVSHNASAASPSYNALNGGAALAAAAEYAFSIPVKQGDVVDFEVSAAVTLNVFDVWFTPHQ